MKYKNTRQEVIKWLKTQIQALEEDTTDNWRNAMRGAYEDAVVKLEATQAEEPPIKKCSMALLRKW